MQNPPYAITHAYYINRKTDIWIIHIYYIGSIKKYVHKKKKKRFSINKYTCGRKYIYLKANDENFAFQYVCVLSNKTKITREIKMNRTLN